MAIPRFEVIALAVLLLAAPVGGSEECPGDLNGDGVVSIDELLTAVQSALVGCPPPPGPRFVDNGDGTVTDRHTGLMWEQKVAGQGCLHCSGDRYEWPAAMSEWITRVNGGVVDDPFGPPQRGLGGHTDWRVPTLEELRSIADCGTVQGCLDPVFGPRCEPFLYLSSTTFSGSATTVFAVEFFRGVVIGAGKTTDHCVRAVRGLR
jgi:hypothetical protein